MEKSKVVKTIVMIAIVIICISLTLFLIHNFYLSNLEKLQFEYEIFDNQKRIIETINSYSCDDYSLEIQRAKEKTNKLLIFPETISETYECNGYSYIEEVRLVDMGLQYRAEIYFCIKYSKKGYDDEIVRISSIANSVNGKKVVFSQNLFNYPSYISIYNNYSWFEYALLDEENFEIIYIYLFDCGKDNICFSNDYIPFKKIKNSDIPRELIESRSYYNMYS